MLTNNHKIHVSLAVWLAHDDYDYDPDPLTISVTSLLKPIKSLLLSMRATTATDMDISSVVKSSLGTAFHNDVESVWRDKRKRDIALTRLGYPKKIIENIVINPTDDQLLDPDAIPVYLEQRMKRKMGKWTISGKYDFVIENTVSDFKSTGTFTYIKQGNTQSYRQQGSMYKWLNPTVITSDYMTIEYLFTDWMQSKADIDKNYPQCQVLSQKFTTMSTQETEELIRSRLAMIDMYMNVPQEEMPPCGEEDLWQDKATWKYYKGGKKTARSTKNFTNPADAYKRAALDGSTGLVIKQEGTVRRCRYCAAQPSCMQAEGYIAEGLLKI